MRIVTRFCRLGFIEVWVELGVSRSSLTLASKYTKNAQVRALAIATQANYATEIDLSPSSSITLDWVLTLVAHGLFQTLGYKLSFLFPLVRCLYPVGRHP
jgi:hypothetical protein